MTTKESEQCIPLDSNPLKAENDRLRALALEMADLIIAATTGYIYGRGYEGRVDMVDFLGVRALGSRKEFDSKVSEWKAKVGLG